MSLDKVKILGVGKDRRKMFLFGGLALFALSGVLFLLPLPAVFSLVLLGGGIFLKILFLVELFRAPDFKMSREIYLILIGVGLILISLLFKNIYPLPWLRALLFYSAIFFKVTGVTLLFFHKKK